MNKQLDVVLDFCRRSLFDTIIAASPPSMIAITADAYVAEGRSLPQVQLSRDY